MFGVGFDDIGPAAIEHGQHVGQDFVDDGIQVIDFQQRKQRLRNAVQPEQQVIDALLSCEFTTSDGGSTTRK